MNNEIESTERFSLARDFPELVEHYLRHKERNALDRNRDILYRRYGLVDGTIHSLQDLGTYHGVCRERVRQVQAKILVNLDKLLTGTLRGRDCNIDRRYVEQYSDLKAGFEEQSSFYTMPEIEVEIQRHLGGRLPTRWLPLFLDVLRLQRVKPSGTKPEMPGFGGLWMRPGAVCQRDVDGVLDVLREVHREAAGESLFNLVVRARNAGAENADESMLRALVRACSRLEIVEEACVRPRFCMLVSAVDRAWRILAEEGRPLHHAEIGRRINQREAASGGNKVFDARNVTNQMTVDNRFVPVGRTGTWALAEWEGIETHTIVEVMQRVLHGAGKPMTQDQLSAAVRECRPAKDNSVKIHSEDRNDIFGRTGDGRVTLKVWKMPEARSRQTVKRTDPDAFLEAVWEVAANRCEMFLSDLISELSECTGVRKATVRSWIGKLDGIESTKGSGRRSAIVRLDTDSIDFRPGSLNQTQRERVQQEIRRCRLQHDTQGMTKKQLHHLVARNVPCKLPTFYRYLAELEKEDEPVERQAA